jgi:hypothetical protein
MESVQILRNHLTAGTKTPLNQPSLFYYGAGNTGNCLAASFKRKISLACSSFFSIIRSVFSSSRSVLSSCRSVFSFCSLIFSASYFFSNFIRFFSDLANSLAASLIRSISYSCCFFASSCCFFAFASNSFSRFIAFSFCSLS